MAGGAVARTVEANTLDALMDLPGQRVHDSRIDGLWQVLILAEFRARRGLPASLLSYDVPQIYATGLRVAAFG